MGKRKNAEKIQKTTKVGVIMKRNVKKQIKKLPPKIQLMAKGLLKDIECNGPVVGGWQNYGKLQSKRELHHCHMNNHYVAVWEVQDDLIKIIYVGSREKAPY